MASKQNIIYIYFKGKHQVISKSQYQYNHGQYLYFADLDLPQTFEVHFSNRDRGDSKPQVGSNKLVEIPDEYYWSGALMIYAWIYLHTGKDDGETVYEVRIPLTKRAKPTDEEPLPQQQGVIDRTIAELNNAVNVTTENANKTEADKTQVANIKNEVITLKEEIDSTATTVTQKAQEAVNAANASETSAQNSARYENSAHNYSDEAKQYAQSAFESKNIANQKAEVATNASTEAMGYRDEALEAKNQAVQAKQNIVDYRDETKGYRDETLTAKNDAQTIKSDVQSLKTQIDKTATDVEINALDAKSSADLSYRSAISADNASLSASQFADEASDFADSASQSASQAEEFKNQSATNVTHYPKVVDGYWYIWDASKNDYVNTNVDARGVKGDKGDVGETGNGIENTVLNSDYTLTITFTDGTSYTTPSIRGEKGLKGDVGNGIASTVLNNDYTLTINFTDGTQYTTPPIRGKQGEKGDQGETGDSGVYIGTDEPTDENVDVWIDTDGTAENFVNDVQINGTSIVNEGVANIPYGSNDNYGLMKASSTNGIFASGGVLSINNASESDIKGGTEELKPITPNREHMATFYGLSKAAGVDEKNSTLSVGEYTDNAKDAIRGMIGAASDEELSSVKEDLTLLSSATRNINTAEIGRYRSLNGLPEYINNVNYAGMDDMVACDASTEYTATFYNMGIGTIRASYYASDKSYISEYHASSTSTLTFTTPNNASYVHAWIYNGSSVTIGDNSHIQIEKGANSTPYVDPYSANDRVARYDVGNLESRVARNISMLSNLLYRNIGTFVCHFGTSYNTWDTIPSQSIFDIERAKRLGFKAIELNILTTSDGKFITMHGVGGKFGSAVTSLDSSDIENTLVSSVTLDYIKTNVRYKSTLDKYKVAPSTLEEALVACHKFGVIPAIQNSSPDVIDMANNILGKNNYILLIYQGDRPTGFDGVCCSWLSIDTESDVLAKCNASGGAYIAGFNTTDSAYESFTDDDWISMFKMVHANGYRASSAYLSNPINANRFLKNGLDFFFTGYQIPDIENGNVCNLTNDETWSDFDITGSISDNIVALSSGQTIKPHDTYENVFLGGGALHIRFNGSIYINMGHYINSAYTLTSDGTEDVYVSTYFTREAPTFTITATDATTVYNLTYKASEA